MGVEVHLFSTRPAARALVSHPWSDDAIARTTYLGTGMIGDRIKAALFLPGWFAALSRHKPDLPSLRSLVVSAPAAMALRRHCAARGITHVHAHSAANSAMIALLAQSAPALTYSVTLHGPMVDYGPAQTFKWAKARFGIAVTQVLKRELSDNLGPHLPDTLHVCSMGVDTDQFVPAGPYTPWTEGETLQLFSCGRLNRVKGHDTTIAALSQLRQAGISLHLKIAGEDDAGGSGYRKVVEQAIAEHGMEDCVTLMGAVDAQTVRTHIQTAHAFVVASRREAIGVAYMEAMACGCPTIGTNAGGVRELIDDGKDGLLVAPEDSDALAAAIQRLAYEPDLARSLSVAGREKVVAQFSARRSAQVLAQACFGNVPDRMPQG